ncbi:MAG: type II secretion system protein [Verrucomicrobiota bacterium]
MPGKSPEPHRNEDAFAKLLELLAVIASIGILAGILLPASVPRRTTGKIMMARVEMANLTAAISQYYSEYGTLPASANATNAAAALGSDFTFGTVVRGTRANGAAGSPLEGQQIVSSSVITQNPSTPGSRYQNVNSEVVAILADADYYPENSPTRHTYNLRQLPFFNARAAVDKNSPGIDTNNILRDPWGMPYIMTLDLNYDGKCADPVVWQTLYRNAGITNFTVPGWSMIWSFGPLKTLSLTQPPNSGTNKYLVTSWK